MSNIVISVKNLTKQFGNFVAVDNISFDVQRGEIFGFLGANGAGKTTLLRIIAGIMEATSGEIIIDGMNYNKNDLDIKREISCLILDVAHNKCPKLIFIDVNDKVAVRTFVLNVAR